jgi:hypothetical protein
MLLALLWIGVTPSRTSFTLRCVRYKRCSHSSRYSRTCSMWWVVSRRVSCSVGTHSEETPSWRMRSISWLRFLLVRTASARSPVFAKAASSPTFRCLGVIFASWDGWSTLGRFVRRQRSPVALLRIHIIRKPKPDSPTKSHVSSCAHLADARRVGQRARRSPRLRDVVQARARRTLRNAETRPLNDSERSSSFGSIQMSA